MKTGTIDALWSVPPAAGSDSSYVSSPNLSFASRRIAVRIGKFGISYPNLRLESLFFCCPPFQEIFLLLFCLFFLLNFTQTLLTL